MPLSQLMEEGILVIVDENANIEGDSEEVTICVTAGNVVGTASVTVFQEKADIEVVITPAEIQPGESAQVEIFELQDGVRIPLLDPRTVSIVEGTTFGKLRSLATGQEAQEFVATTDELEFVANDVLDVESARIVIRVETPLGGGIIVTSAASQGGLGEEDAQQRRVKFRHSENKNLSLRAQQALVAQDAPESCPRKFLAEGVVVVKRQELDHFVVTVDPPTIAFTETARIFVQAKDAENKDVDLSPDALLTFSLEGESAFGTFVDADGETLKTVPVELRDVRYADARDGRILFAAVAANPVTSAAPIVQVVLQSDPTKAGEKVVVVVEQTLRIVMIGPAEVRPLIPGEVRLIVPGEPTSTTEFRVELTRGGIQVGGHPFELTTEYVDGLGGHDHLTPRRPAEPDAVRFQNYGYFVSRQMNTDQPMNPLTESTLDDGQATYEYTASFFGDVMEMRVQSLQNVLLRDKVTIEERVRGLQPIEEGASYRLTGAYGEAGVTSRHTETHNGIRSLRVAIVGVAADYLDATNGTLGINDLSLPSGGLFDIGNNWRPPHNQHRKGTSVDVDRQARRSDGSFERVDQNILDDIARRWHLIRIPEPPGSKCPDCIHYEAP